MPGWIPAVSGNGLGMGNDADDAWAHIPVMLRKNLLIEGWNDRAILRMVLSGAWTRVRHGAYVVTRDWRSLDDAGRHGVVVRAAVAQSKTELVPSHTSAMPFYEGPTWRHDLRWVHGTRLDGKGGRRAAGVQQHCGRLIDGDITERHGMAVMAPTRVGLEVTTVLSSEAALVSVNHLLHRKHTTVDDLRARYEQGIEFWKGTLSTDVVLRLATPAAESVGESRVLFRCYAAGLPAPILQLEVRDADGQFLGRVDFAWPEHGVFLEFDGMAKYSRYLRPGETVADAVLREKRREERIVEATGWRCIRVTWADLENPYQLVRRLRALLGVTHSLIG